MKARTKAAKKTPPKQYTLGELQGAVAERLVGTKAHLRPPSMPTLKNMSRSGALKKGGTIDEAVTYVFEHILSNEAYYTQGDGQGRPGPGSPQSGAQLNPQLADRILSELQGLGKRISNIENQIVMEVRVRESAIDPRLSKALEQLDATRKHVLNRLDAELQAIKPGGGRGFDAASAVDAARILGIVSQIKDIVQRWDSAPSTSAT